MTVATRFKIVLIKGPQLFLVARVANLSYPQYWIMEGKVQNHHSNLMWYCLKIRYEIWLVHLLNICVTYMMLWVFMSSAPKGKKNSQLYSSICDLVNVYLPSQHNKTFQLQTNWRVSLLMFGMDVILKGFISFLTELLQ